MKHALSEANKAFEHDEVPVGGVLVHADLGILFKGHNTSHATCNPLAHVEMLAIKAGQQSLASPFLKACTLYVTLEPCTVCAAALARVRLSYLVFGAYNPKDGAIVHGPRLREISHISYIGGILEYECGAPLRAFFAKKRHN